MARGDVKGVSSGKMKFRVIEFEYDGADERIAEGLKAFAAAVTRSGSTPQKSLPQQQRQVLSAPEVDQDYDDDSTLEPEGDAEETSQTRSPAKERKKYVPRSPKFLSDLNLDAATVKLADFVAEKDPKTMFDKYIVVAEWFKEHFDTSEFNVDHVHTAFKTLGWQAQMPADPVSPLRDLKQKKNWLDKGSGDGMYKINWHGTGRVNKMGAVKTA